MYVFDDRWAPTSYLPYLPHTTHETSKPTETLTPLHYTTEILKGNIYMSVRVCLFMDVCACVCVCMCVHVCVCGIVGVGICVNV